MSTHKNNSLGELLLAKGLITSAQLEEARAVARHGSTLQRALVQAGVISEEDLVNFIAEHMDVPRLELGNFDINDALILLIPETLARKYLCIPVLKIEDSLTCAMADVFDLDALDELANVTGMTIEPAVATEAEIRAVLDKHYGVKGNFGEVIEEFEARNWGSMEEVSTDEVNRLRGLVEEAPIIRMVDKILDEAVDQRASDVHLAPQEDRFVIRFRIDGFLHEKDTLAMKFHPAVISRVKILANLDISERRRPQDGRFQIKVHDKPVDVRVSCVPTIYGEKIVLRLLDLGTALLPLTQIGLPDDVMPGYRSLLGQPNGILLVAGPTGSGKTTTLYSSLNEINSSDKNVITLEDPVEYRLKGITQIQVNPSVDLTFANGLRSILRQDPDIILVGEIRDLDTAEMAVQASLTGHLVLSTLHTNDAPSAVTRLTDMGIEPYLIASALIGVLAQRLVRLKCRPCNGRGCQRCLQSGYSGRTGIYEMMLPNEDIRRLALAKSSAEDIRRAAVDNGMRTLHDDGMQKVAAGLTSREEVLRVIKEG